MWKTICKRNIHPAFDKQNERTLEIYQKSTGRHVNKNGHSIKDFQCRAIHKLEGVPLRYNPK